MRLDEAQFTVFDVETTGLYPHHGDRICEIAAIRAEPGHSELKKFHYLVDPGRKISYGAFLVNRITEKMVKGKPRIEEVLPYFMRFIEGSVLVAYNAPFDLGFLEAALAANRHLLDDYYVIDALRLARRLFDGVSRYNLGVVSRHLGIESEGEHRALSDALMTWEVFKRELDRLYADGVRNVEDVAYSKRTGYDMASVEKAISEQETLNTIR